MEIIVADPFAKYMSLYMADVEYQGLRNFLKRNPKAGRTIPNSGGVRLLHWVIANGGLECSLRVVYYVHQSAEEVWLLTIFPKGEINKISSEMLRKITLEISHARL